MKLSTNNIMVISKKIYIALGAALMLTNIDATAKDLKIDVPVTHNHWWNAPERACVKLVARDTLNHANASRLKLSVAKDLDKSTEIFSISRDLSLVAGGKSDTTTFEIALPEPGFYSCTVYDDNNPVKSFNIGYEPTNVVSLPDAMPDMDQFWQTALDELKQVEPQYTMTEIKEKSGKKRKIYLVTMRSWGGDTISGYLAMPIAKGKYPVHIYYNGYGAQPWCVEADARPDFIEFIPSSRGQFLDKPRNKYGDWIRYNLNDPANYYYKGAFLDCVRAIDFVAQLEKADTANIFAEGGSQGGAYTLAAAALDHRLKAIAPYIPFLSDYRHYFSIVPWPANAVKEAAAQQGLSDQQMYTNLSYFDIKNLARRIKCPVLMGIGLQDPVCPPHTNMSSYNLIETPKQLIIYPTLGHTVDYSDWSPRVDRFFRGEMSK